MLKAAIWNHLLLAMLALAASNATAREPYREREQVIISQDLLVTIIRRATPAPPDGSLGQVR